jgi:hypothetical protein
MFSPPAKLVQFIHKPRARHRGRDLGDMPCMPWPVSWVVWRFGITLWALRPAPRKSFRCSPFASGNGYHIHVPGVHGIRYYWWVLWTMVSKGQKHTRILTSDKHKPNNSQITLTLTPTRIYSPSVSPRRYQGWIHMDMVRYAVARLCRCVTHDLGGSSVMLDTARKWRAKLLQTWKAESVLAGCP